MATSIRVRMYRTGFGDCFLLTLGANATTSHILIDFGAHMHGEIGTMEDVMTDIEKTTGSKLSLVVASHAHRDHISGFGKFAARFANFEIGEVWLPWTDNPKDKIAATLKKKQLALYETLDTHLRMGLRATEANPQYAAALNALSNLRGNETATTELARGFGTGAKVRYFEAGASIAKVAKIAGLSAEILAPSKEKSFLSRMNPPSDQQFLTAPGDTSGAIRPFPRLEIKKKEEREQLRKEKQPLLPQDEIKALHALAEAPADRLALALDNVRNNTSLVILFRFQGKTMLFPGDAQWGNWQSWISTDKAKQIISEIDFLKIAHHGSENATPVDVVKGLRATGLAAMMATQKEPFPTIPRKPLITELEKHCGIAVRSDWVNIKKAPKGPPQPKKLPNGFMLGELFIDYSF